MPEKGIHTHHCPLSFPEPAHTAAQGLVAVEEARTEVDLGAAGKAAVEPEVPEVLRSSLPNHF